MSNPLLNVEGLPLFDAIRPEHVTPAIGTLLERCKAVVAELEAPMAEVTWDNFVTPLDDCTEQLSRAWGIVGHLSAVVDTPELRAAYNENIPRITEFWTSLSQNQALFEKYKALRNAASFGSLSPARRRVIENTLREGLRYKPEAYTIEDDEGTFKNEAFLIACANASQYGNNAYIAPNASMKDGLMDVTVMEPFNAIEAPQIAIQLFNRTIDHNSHIKTFRTKKVIITRQTEGAAHCDGEPMTTGKTIEVEIVKKSFNVVVNPEAHTHKEGMRQIFADYFTGLATIQQELKLNSDNLKALNKSFIDKLKKL